ncbi:MAG: hypothetical protein LBE91_20010 [Tannerella sp.]|jgi:hypothetical protein|nr:hypothetical protein [Tannerella sp.]
MKNLSKLIISVFLSVILIGFNGCEKTDAGKVDPVEVDIEKIDTGMLDTVIIDPATVDTGMVDTVIIDPATVDTVTVDTISISGIWIVKALSISGELTDIGSPPGNATKPDISIVIPDGRQGYIEGHTFLNSIGFDFKIEENQQINLAKRGIFDATRFADDDWGMAFRDHILFNVRKFEITSNELKFMDSQNNTVILFINYLK